MVDYIFFDELKAALSSERQLSLLIQIYQSAKEGSQFIIASHSPILLGILNAQIYSFDNGMIQECNYEETESYKITELFLNHREKLFEKIIILMYKFLHTEKNKNSYT